jgi:hypothetical protein
MATTDNSSNLYRRLSIDASYQVSYQLAKRFQRKSCFRNQPIRNKNCLRRPYIWWEAPMEGSVLSFLKAEWKVSDTVLRYLERFKSYDQKKTEILRFRWDKMARNRIKLSFLSFDRLISQNIAIAECWNCFEEIWWNYLDFTISFPTKNKPNMKYVNYQPYLSLIFWEIRLWKA